MVLDSYHPLSPLFAFASFPFLGQVLKGPHDMNEQSGAGGLDGRRGQGSEMERQEILWSFDGRNPHMHLLISSLKGENTGREACLGPGLGLLGISHQPHRVLLSGFGLSLRPPQA